MDRRGFLAGALGAAVVGMTGPRGVGASVRPERAVGSRGRLPDAWGVQLYTLRSVMQDDVAGTLAALADLGYGEVEFAGLYGWDAADMRAALDGLGMAGVSSHVSLGDVESDLERLLDEAETLGVSTLIVPSLPRSARSIDGYRAVADTLNRAGDAARARGVAVGFHNHGVELQPLDSDAGGDGGGPIPLDILLEHTDPALVTFQLDLFWAVDAGADPLAWFGRHSGRFTSVHAKDRTAAGDMVAVGDGTLDFATLLRAGEDAGVRHVFVEHDRPDDPLRSVTRSIEHLESLR